MENIFQTMQHVSFKILGIQKLIENWDTEPWLPLFVVFCMAMTIVWMVKLFPKPAAAVGKGFGGIAIGLAGVAIWLWTTHFLVGLNTSMVGLSRCVLIIVVGITVGITIVIGILISIIVKYPEIGETPERWRSDPGTGLNGVKWSRVIFGLFPIAFLLNHPEMNNLGYYIPSGTSAVLGLVSLVFKTSTVRRIK
ncbi:MAG: hypothetical protein IMF10_05640 [Proteobacteria bacterium]|nr:hypothetical protein [Pseudomonadota bacterium]